MRTRLTLLPLVLALPACSLIDPFTRPGTWNPEGLSQTNLNASAASPGDLVSGRAAHDALGQTAAAAVDRLRTDHVRPLPDSAIAQITPVSNGAGSGGAPAPGNGGP
jgi:hypothetical protein